ncbi:MAG TPA: hydrogenase nickel incorporation protein HypB [Candidatus Limnocylindrales bacterium]
MTEHSRTVQLPVGGRVLQANDEIATEVRGELARRGVFAIDLIGAPGSGKTALLEATLRVLAEGGASGGEEARVGAGPKRRRPAVLVGDLTTRRDGDRLARWCDRVVQISTGEGCHLEAGQVRRALDEVDMTGVDLLFIENVGNLICPVGFDLGQNVKVGLFSLTEGDDKAAKHPYLVTAADLLLLNKVDLAPHLTFDRELFEADVRLLNPTVPILGVSATTGEGLDAWIQWIEDAANTPPMARSMADSPSQ